MTNMNVQTIWNIRDARGLTTYEKAFLFTVASRGMARTTRDRLMKDLDCSTGQISKIVKSLAEKDLINVYPGYWKDGKKTPTAYTVKDDVLATFVPVPDTVHQMNESVHHMNTPVHHMNEVVHHMATKGTNKVTGKVTMKENNKDTAEGGVEVREEELFSCTLPNYEVKTLEGVTYFLNSNGVTKVEETTESEDTSLTSKDESPVLNSKKETAVSAKSKEITANLMKQARADKAAVKREEVEHLNRLVVTKKLGEKVKAEAMLLLADKTFAPGKPAFDRALAAAGTAKNKMEVNA